MKSKLTISIASILSVLVLVGVGSGALNSAIAWVFRIFCRIIGLS